jgi:hypothetical protein
MNMVRSILKGKHLPKELWGETVSTATYILNRCPTKKLEGITLEECWFGVNPRLSHLRVFGSITHRHVPDQLRRKLDDKSSQMIMIGYHSIGGYKLLDPVNKQVVISRDVIIDELKEWDWNKNINKDSVRILCDKPTSEADKRSLTRRSQRSNRYKQASKNKKHVYKVERMCDYIR